MSRIAIVIGLEDTKSTGPLSLVYLGRSGEEMRQAIEKSTATRHLVIPHAQGVFKNNPRAGENRVALARAAEATLPAEPDPVDPVAAPRRPRK